MIDDMASLKQAMEQMDAYDDAVAQAAKDSAARILSDAKLSFSKLAELIEQRRLLLSPKIVANIKRMDQPDILGDSPFHETRYALRRERQGFRQIAEALELNGAAAPALPHPIEMETEPAALAWLFYPLRHPIRFIIIALLAFMLFNTLRGLILFHTLRGFVEIGRQVSGHVADVGAARQGADATQSSVSPSATPSVGPATAPAPSANAPAPSATAPAPATNAAAPLTPPPAAPAGAAASTPHLDAKGGSPSNSAANDRLRMVQRALEDRVLAGLRRNSRSAGPCIRGAGGCYWGGGRY